MVHKALLEYLDTEEILVTMDVLELMENQEERCVCMDW